MPIELKPTEPVPLPKVEDTPVKGSYPSWNRWLISYVLNRGVSDWRIHKRHREYVIEAVIRKLRSFSSNAMRAKLYGHVSSEVLSLDATTLLKLWSMRYEFELRNHWDNQLSSYWKLLWKRSIPPRNSHHVSRRWTRRTCSWSQNSLISVYKSQYAIDPLRIVYSEASSSRTWSVIVTPAWS